MSPPHLDLWRISDGWHDVRGHWNPVSEVLRDRLRNSIDEKLREEDSHPAPPVWFVHPGETHELHSTCDIHLEPAPGHSAQPISSLSGHPDLLAVNSLPSDLPLGRHRLVPLNGGTITNLFVVPHSQRLIERGWGWTTQLYATRSSLSWGQGDLGDLRTLAAWASDCGASLVSHNPLGDTLPLSHQEPSPYFTSSRRYRSLLYLNLNDVPGAGLIADQLARLAVDGYALNSLPLIERDEIFRLKLDALGRIWTAVSGSDSVASMVAAQRCDADAEAHATFNTLVQRFGTGWRSWDRIYTDPHSRSVAEFRDSHRDDVDFWLWIQALSDQQYREAAGAGAGLMNDLPVGFNADGFDAWMDQDCLALDWRIGAPGDDFNPDGQNWGIVPYLPQKLRARGYEPWIATLRSVMAHTTALRIDHIMGLFRLFVIPANAETTNGAYLYHYGTEMLDIALMEAARAGVTLCGEDLGTVEDRVRRALAERNVMGYRVLWFEDSPMTDWSDASIGSISTHDLPTIAGLIGGGDAKQRANAGLAVDLTDDEAMLDRLMRTIDAQSQGAESPMNSPTILLAHRGLAEAGSRVVFASLEDACAVINRPNVPGTVDENPNWREPLPVPIEDLDGTLAPAIAEEMRAHR